MVVTTTTILRPAQPIKCELRFCLGSGGAWIRGKNDEISVFNVLFCFFSSHFISFRFVVVVVVITWAHEDRPKCDECAHKQYRYIISHFTSYSQNGFDFNWYPPDMDGISLSRLLLDHDHTTENNKRNEFIFIDLHNNFQHLYFVHDWCGATCDHVNFTKQNKTKHYKWVFASIFLSSFIPMSSSVLILRQFFPFFFHRIERWWWFCSVSKRPRSRTHAIDDDS